MSRQRMTWGGDGRRHASAHPATPWEGDTHPASYPDPEADAYENGDPSSWAEDPHPPPYRTSPAPAMPYDDGGYRHPATQPGAPARNASVNVRVAAERKAAKCLRIAATLLGPDIVAAAARGVQAAESMLEDQALDLMDLTDARIASTLRRMAGTSDKAGEEVEEEAEVSAKTASEKALLSEIRSLRAEVASFRRGKRAFDMMSEDDALLAQMLHEEKMGGQHMGEADMMSEEDALLAQMLHEEKMGGQHMAEADMMSEEDVMLAQMLHEEKMGGQHMGEADMMSEDDALLAQMLHEEKKGGQHMAEADMMSEDDVMLAEMLREAEAPAMAPAMAMVEDDEPIMGGFEDPMAMGEADAMGADEEATLASLFASRQAGDDSDEDESEEVEVEEEEEVEEKKPVGKTAGLRPQPRKPSAGARTIGTQTRVASTASDMSDLSNLWASAPDVSKVFGS